MRTSARLSRIEKTLAPEIERRRGWDAGAAERRRLLAFMPFAMAQIALTGWHNSFCPMGGTADFSLVHDPEVVVVGPGPYAGLPICAAYMLSAAAIDASGGIYRGDEAAYRADFKRRLDVAKSIQKRAESGLLDGPRKARKAKKKGKKR